MAKDNKNTIQKCQKHKFILKPILNSCHFSNTITATFCNIQKGKRKCKTSQQTQIADFPVFNNDLNFATQTFILNSQKNFFKENFDKLNREHNKKVLQVIGEKSQMWEPKPRSKYSYCNACREDYDDYRTHIRNPTHKRKIQLSRFNDYIIELTLKFNKQQKIQQKQNEGTTINLTKEQQSNIDQSVQIITKPIKKFVKLEIQNNSQNFLRPQTLPMHHQTNGMYQYPPRSQFNNPYEPNIYLQNYQNLQNFYYLQNLYNSQYRMQPFYNYIGQNNFNIKKNMAIQSSNYIVIDDD